MRKLKWWIIVPLLLFSAYLLGPHPATSDYNPALPPVPAEATSLEQYIRAREAVHTLRPNNEARIVWANDSLKQRTPYSILYLHGFSASQAEGEPVHRNIARKFGCNLYLSRLAEHGIDTSEQLVNLTGEKLWQSAKEAFAIAAALGDSVIVMGTSTGGTLALMLGAKLQGIHSLVLLSPNIAIFDDNAWVLNNPWGLQIAKLITGSQYVFSTDTRPLYKQYWNYGYRMEAVVQLEEMLETAMTPELFSQVKQPALMLYYFKDPVHQDSVVKVDAMLRMFNQLGTPPNMKKAVPIPTAGNHVLGSYIKSADVGATEAEIESFLRSLLPQSEK